MTSTRRMRISKKSLQTPSVTDKNSTWIWEGPGLISGGTAQPIRMIFWGETNGLVASGIRVNPNMTPMSRQALRRNRVSRGPICDEGVIGWVEEK